MAYSARFKNHAIELRKKGHSITEIAKKLDISIATSSTWLSNIVLSTQIQNRLKDRKILGQYKSVRAVREKRKVILREFQTNAFKTLSSIKINKNLS